VYAGAILHRAITRRNDAPHIVATSRRAPQALANIGIGTLNQQVSELLPVGGIDFLGPLPPEIQQITVFSAGLHVRAKEPDAAEALVNFLTAPAARAVFGQAGMEPG
jgi:ABC-type molybdate transport system substrate-binding protein